MSAFLLLFWMLLTLLFPKPLTLKLTTPDVIFQDEEELTLGTDSIEQRDKTFLYNQIFRYNKRIEKIKYATKKGVKSTRHR